MEKLKRLEGIEGHYRLTCSNTTEASCTQCSSGFDLQMDGTCVEDTCDDDTFNTFDTQISIFSGSCGEDGSVGLLECVGGNDQGCGDQSRVIWATVHEEKYYILVHGWSIAEGDFRLKLESIS